MKKGIVSLVMILALTAGIFGGAGLTVYAANQEITTEGSVETTVKTKTDGNTGSTSSAFVIAAPQEIELQRTQYITFTGGYQVGVKAVLADGKKVKIVPATSFDMSDGGGNEYTATVTQDITTWVAESATPGAGEIATAVSDFVMTDGSISVDIEKVGEYTGTLGFTVSLE